MDPTVSTIDTQMDNSHLRSMELFGSNPEKEFPVSAMSAGLTSSPFSMLMSHDVSTLNNQQGRSVSMSNQLNLQQYSELTFEAAQHQVPYASVGEEKFGVLNKRKAMAELPANHSLQNMSISNKRPALVGSSREGLGMSQLITQNKRKEVHSKSPRTSAFGKKVGHIEPKTKNSQSALNNQNMKSGVSGIDAEVTDPVRVKLRESLGGALALVLEKKATSLDADKTEDNAAVPAQKGEQPATSLPATSSTETESAGNGSCGSGSQILLKDLPGDNWKFEEQDFQSNSIFPGEDAPFGDSLYFRDELLQGNGLSWAMDFDAQIAEMQASESAVKDEPYGDADVQDKEQEVLSPESVANRIESELFTLFGGVNKKYKEKGRSLLFNLKDRNNPELRERVMSGEISPERLCRMTAEELASKELSQWRMAKAEELDQMKVLPDSDVNVRRLVKKTHKGEYQVEFDQDISVVEDVPANISIVRERARDKASGSSTERHKIGDGAEGHGDGQCTITIPGDGTDIQGLMVDDMRDLPPILSLDEFMESLDKEPPFETLPGDSGKRTPDAEPDVDNETSDGGTDRSSTLPSKDSVALASVINGEMDLKSVQCDDHVKSTEADKLSEKSIRAEQTKVDKGGSSESIQHDAHVKSADSQRASEGNNKAALVKIEHLWQGLLQLTLSSTAYFVARYKSGEKASTKNWPGFIEIKGRVRLDAFDKFVQELPKSRTRATMVVHFTLTERSTDDERCNLIDLIDSYVSDQRIGYAEPASGLELYLCPPRSKTVEMIVAHLPKGYTEEIRNIEDGLIGILVWRKERIPPPSVPNPSSQHKPITAGQHSTPVRQLPDKDVKRNVHYSAAVSPLPTLSNPPPASNEDDDAPPGFGPSGGPKFDDDLPEFNFSAGPNPSKFPTLKLNNPAMSSHQRPEAPSRQVEQMRELIQKYGKSSDSDNSMNGIPIQPWNDDDEDDIPEWQPHAIHPQQQPPDPLGLHSQTHVLSRPPFQQPSMTPPLQPNFMAQGAWRHHGPNIPQPGGSPRPGPVGAQFYRAPTGRGSRNRRASNAFNRGRGS